MVKMCHMVYIEGRLSAAASWVSARCAQAWRGRAPALGMQLRNTL